MCWNSTDRWDMSSSKVELGWTLWNYQVCSPVLHLLQSHVTAVLGEEAGQEEVALGGRLPGGLGFGSRARPGRVGLQGRAEAHPHRVGGPVGARGGGGHGRWQAARSDQHQLITSALAAHRLGGVEAATKQAILVLKVNTMGLWWAKVVGYVSAVALPLRVLWTPFKHA